MPAYKYITYINNNNNNYVFAPTETVNGQYTMVVRSHFQGGAARVNKCRCHYRRIFFSRHSPFLRYGHIIFRKYGLAFHCRIYNNTIVLVIWFLIFFFSVFFFNYFPLFVFVNQLFNVTILAEKIFERLT